jgi:hypothetical protein
MKAIYEGDMKEGILFAGQDCDGISDLPSVKELIDQMITEAKETLEATKKLVQPQKKWAFATLCKKVRFSGGFKNLTLALACGHWQESPRPLAPSHLTILGN